ncbi:MAG: hypothetical protein H3Z53_05305, partial [archaeon]|nr:hypothetical protein [archaeon]MCP8313772.1 hypothetical protein [archaeon]
MKKSVSTLLILILLSAIAFTSVPYISAQQYAVSMLWSSPMGVNDVAVSKDGNYIAAVNDTGIYYFAYNDPNPIWWFIPPGGTDFLSVAISNDGEYVVGGISTGYLIYYNNTIDTNRREGEQDLDDYTWFSVNLLGPIQRRTLDMSDNGEYVVVGGTGTDVYYFAGCTARSDSGQSWTWWHRLYAWDVLAVDMSSDGKYVAAGGENITKGFPGFVVFYKDADQLSGLDPDPKWDAWSRINAIIRDIAVSDDGYSVAAVTAEMPKCLYYWADATALSGDPDATWKNDYAFDCVDMSSYGDEVVAGTAIPFCGLHFWNYARWLEGDDVDETWIEHEGEDILDVAISDDGEIIAATAERYIDPGVEYWIYFYTSSGSLIGE